MSRYRVVLVSLLAVAAVSGLATASASAKPAWFVEGKELAKGTPLVERPGAFSEFFLEVNVEGKALRIFCEAVKLKNGMIFNLEKVGRDTATLELTKCKTNLGGCEAVAEPIRMPEKELGRTVLVEYENEKNEKKIGDDFLPEKETAVFTTITIPGKECPGALKLTGLKEAKEGEGGIVAEISPEGASVSKILRWPVKLITKATNSKKEAINVGSLELGGFPVVSFFGDLEVELAGKEKWEVK